MDYYLELIADKVNHMRELEAENKLLRSRLAKYENCCNCEFRCMTGICGSCKELSNWHEQEARIETR